MSTPHQYNLGFIRDHDIFTHVMTTVKKYSSQIDLKLFNKNIVDPIKLTFDSHVYNRDIEDIILQECMWQLDKTRKYQIANFHQELIGSTSNGWFVPAKGFDIVNNEKHIYVVMKNQYDTMNASLLQKTYIKMQSQLLNDNEATCLLVEIIAPKSQDIEWKIPIDESPRSHKKIRRVSIDKFYEMVFNDPSAFVKLCKVLPIIIDDVLASLGGKNLTNTVLEELKAFSPDIEKSLFKLAFQAYNGFDTF